MANVAIVTDSNSGITQKAAAELGIRVLPMPFYIDEKLYFEDITLTQEAFYQKLAQDADISTSQPTPADVTGLWDELLESYDQIVHIPMSSGRLVRDGDDAGGRRLRGPGVRGGQPAHLRHPAPVRAGCR